MESHYRTEVELRQRPREGLSFCSRVHEDQRSQSDMDARKAVMNI